MNNFKLLALACLMVGLQKCTATEKKPAKAIAKLKTQPIKASAIKPKLPAKINQSENEQYKLGIKYLYENDYGHALDYFNKIINAPKTEQTDMALVNLALGTKYFFGKTYNGKTYDQGVNQDYTKALKYFNDVVNEKNANPVYIDDAKFFLGSMYKNGWAVTQDNSKAIQYFNDVINNKKANPAYILNAQEELSSIAIDYYVRKDYSKAMKYFTDIANNKNSDPLIVSAAKMEIAQMYLHGNGVTQDYSKAIPYLNDVINFYKKPVFNKELGLTISGSTNDLSFAQYTLGTLFYSGLGVPQDYSKAIYYFNNVINNRNPQLVSQNSNADASNIASANNNLGIIYANGNGTAQDSSKAIQYFNEVINTANGTPALIAQAQLFIGSIYFNGGNNVTKDYSKALKYFTDVINTPSTAKILNTVINIPGADPKTVATAQYYIGVIYAYGKGVTQDFSKALQYLNNAINTQGADPQTVTNAQAVIQKINAVSAAASSKQTTKTAQTTTTAAQPQGALLATGNFGQSSPETQEAQKQAQLIPVSTTTST